MKKSGKEALLEIGVEHLPARFAGPAMAQLCEKAAAFLKEERLAFAGVSALGTPRRLALVVRGVPAKSESLQKTVLGPAARFLKDEQGRFTPQAAGFAKAQGVKPEELETVESPKGPVLAVRKVVPGEAASAVLARVFSKLLSSLQFPKTMVWEESGLRFARPIRGLLALYGRQVVRLEAAGVRSGNKALGPSIGGKPVPVTDASAYAARLRNQCVIVDPAERREKLSRALDQAARSVSGRIDKDPDLLEETLWLTEHPTPVPGRFARSFLELPKALLSTVLKKQLKFFPVLGASGSLEPAFVGVRDGVSEGQKEVQEGYERVVEARFNDALFFHGRDRRTRLEEKRDRLKGVAFQKDLGSMFDKSERVLRLSAWLCGNLVSKDLPVSGGDVSSIARLAYADLVTEVVKEFPELQGNMGGHYARLDGLSERVALGIEEFYLPVSAKAPLPTYLEGCAASLAGKLDTMAAMFSVGLAPTGSEDPFALRRAGTGVVRIILEKQLPVDLDESIRQAVSGLERPGDPAPLADFLWQRAQACLEEMGYPADEVRAVREGALADLPRAFKRLLAVHALRPDADFAALATAFKRAANLLKQAGVEVNGGPDRALASLEAETALFDALESAERGLSERLEGGDYEGGLRELVRLKPSVDRFFETVRVMDAAEAEKKNRLALLSRLVRLFKSVADISVLQPRQSK